MGLPNYPEMQNNPQKYRQPSAKWAFYIASDCRQLSTKRYDDLRYAYLFMYLVLSTRTLQFTNLLRFFISKQFIYLPCIFFSLCVVTCILANIIKYHLTSRDFRLLPRRG